MSQQDVGGKRILEKSDNLTLKIPVRLRTREGEKIIQVPSGGNPHHKGKLEQALIRAVPGPIYGGRL